MVGFRRVPASCAWHATHLKVPKGIAKVQLLNNMVSALFEMRLDVAQHGESALQDANPKLLVSNVWCHIALRTWSSVSSLQQFCKLGSEDVI